MLKAGGDLVGQGMVREGKGGRNYYVYGLATNYKSEGAIPIILYLDFFKASARVLLSTGPFPILRALN